MKNKDLLECELNNWSKFLLWLEKINLRKGKSQINEPQKEEGVKE